MAGGNTLTFADLTGFSADATGEVQSFLSTEEHFRTVKTLHDKNLIVPLSGDFGGPKTIRAVGDYLKRQGGTVSAFYVSNVEQYLFQDSKATAFYENVASLPRDRDQRVHPALLDAPHRRRNAVALCHRPIRRRRRRRSRLLQQRRAGVCAVRSFTTKYTKEDEGHEEVFWETFLSRSHSGPSRRKVFR